VFREVFHLVPQCGATRNHSPPAMHRTDTSEPETDAMLGSNDPALAPPKEALFRLEVERFQNRRTTCAVCGKCLLLLPSVDPEKPPRLRRSNAVTCSRKCRVTKFRRSKGVMPAFRTGIPRGVDTSCTKHLAPEA
jgi:hypothetical protein